MRALRELCSRSCSLNVIDLVNKLEAEARADRQGRMADRLDFVVLDAQRIRCAASPFAQTGGQLLFHLVSHLYEQTSVIVTTNLDFGAFRASALIPSGTDQTLLAFDGQASSATPR